MYSLKYVVLLLCILPWVSSGPMKEPKLGDRELNVRPELKPLDNSVSDYIIMVLENLREKMISGIPSIGVPVLDPLTIGGLGLDIPTSQILEITGFFDDMTLSGLSDFEIVDVVADILTFTAKINLTIPALTLQGNYDLNGTALFDILPVFGEGAFVINLYEVEVYLGVVAVEDAELGLQIETLTVTLDATSGSVVMGDLFGGGMMETVLDIVLTDIIVDLINEVSDRLLEDLTDWLKTELNLALRGTELFATSARANLPSKLPMLASRFVLN